MAQRAILSPEVPIGLHCPFGPTGVGQGRSRGPHRSGKEVSFHLGTCSGENQMWKVSVPICFYLFPVCSPKYEPEVFVQCFVLFCFQSQTLQVERLHMKIHISSFYQKVRKSGNTGPAILSSSNWSCHFGPLACHFGPGHQSSPPPSYFLTLKLKAGCHLASYLHLCFSYTRQLFFFYPTHFSSLCHPPGNCRD